MSGRAISDQLRPAAPTEQRAILNYTLTPPDGGRVRRGEYLITEAEWLNLIKGLEAAHKEQM